MLDGGAEDDDEEEDGEHDRHGEGGDELVRLIRGDLLRDWVERGVLERER